MSITGIKHPDGSLAWPEGGNIANSASREKGPSQTTTGQESSPNDKETVSSLGVWRKNQVGADEGQGLNQGEAQNLLECTAPQIARTPKHKLAGLQDVIERFWINPAYF